MLVIMALFLPFKGRLGEVYAQVAAQMKLWDQKHRFPKVNAVEFKGDEASLSMYDAIYGHGAMWENEFMGFRVYMDHRQSIDLYGKKKPQLELDSTNFYTTPEQMAQGYGEDILFVGASIGAGSFRGYVDGAPVFINPVDSRGQRVVNEGPDSAIVEVYATNWIYGNDTLQVCQRFTARRGHREVQVDVKIVESGEKSVDDLLFCTGVQKLQRRNAGLMRSDGLVGSWGSNAPDQNNPDMLETLGIGVCVPEKYLVEVKEDSLNYLCVVHPVAGHIRYYIVAASDMQQQGGFHSSQAWFTWLKEIFINHIPINESTEIRRDIRRFRGQHLKRKKNRRGSK